MDHSYRQFRSQAEAHEFLKNIGAPARLIRHVSLVGEAAELLIERIRQIGVSFDEEFVRLGVAFHDAGKTLHPEELDVKGNRHERAGEELLKRWNVDPALARCCVSHGQWQVMDCSFEELLIALADTLWKGKRNEELEKRVIAGVENLSGRDKWEMFVELDSHFESIAAGGSDRLARSR